MRSKAALLFVCGVTASSLQAQTELEFCLTTDNGPNGLRFHLGAQLLNPEGPVLAVIADIGFTLTGLEIANVDYNPAFDSEFFGDADLTVTSTSIDFVGGNTLPPLNNAGGPDSSNPLHIMSFDASSFDTFTLVGQVTGAYEGSPFPIILTYQNADGTAGDTPYSFPFFCVPAPGVAPVVAFAGVAAVRRRR